MRGCGCPNPSFRLREPPNLLEARAGATRAVPCGAMVEIETVETYIEGAEPKAQPLLRELRRIVRAAAPNARERIKYGMPTYDLGGQPLLNFAGVKRHVAVYGLVHEDAAVPPDLAPYLVHRSTLRFAIGGALPEAALDAAVRAKVEALATR